jgi:hypothetical protein
MRKVRAAGTDSHRKAALTCVGGKSRSGRRGGSAVDPFVSDGLNVDPAQLRATPNINLEQGFDPQNGL